MKRYLLVFFIVCTNILSAQSVQKLQVLNAQNNEPVAGASLQSADSSFAIVADNKGMVIIKQGFDSLLITATGFERFYYKPGTKSQESIFLQPLQKEMDAVVVTGTLKAVRRMESPVAVEVYTPQFLKKNPSPSIFESLQNVNGVRPQLNCSVCNTGDIHINGLEGPYTMITIDGMPIISSLASVYGLFGIPTQLIERIEIVKGPASGLYGSEAIGGLINIITRSPEKAPSFSLNTLSTSWLENSVDIGFKFRPAKKLISLTGINYYHYGHALDKNKDGFTDVTLQHRISLFNKLSASRKNNRVTSLATRVFYEDRWGGDMKWSSKFRGTDSIYGESIYTKRIELIGNYQLPVSEKMFFSFSATAHDQNSYYGHVPYMGKQSILFGQLTWDKLIGSSHSLLTGINTRYNFYDDNSTATRDTLSGKNKPDKSLVPGIFIQDEWKAARNHLILLGLRLDHHPLHHGIFTPRFAWKWSLNEQEVFRLNAGTGFRVVSLFTEEHAALTGARAVEVLESLNPERSYNANINYTRSRKWTHGSINFDISAWYSHFTNQIIADYDTDPNKIIYKNLHGYADSKGMTVNIEFNAGHRLKTLAGITIQDVVKTEKDMTGKKIRTTPVLTEKWSGTWAITYSIPRMGLTLDYTGNLYGPMRLPLLSSTDPRPGHSPVWSLQNLQVSKRVLKKSEIFVGIKNLLNWTPAKSTPFIIARSHDPFDKKVKYDASGNILATPENPYALSFDPSYAYAPNQGMRVFAGIRLTLK